MKPSAFTIACEGKLRLRSSLLVVVTALAALTVGVPPTAAQPEPESLTVIHSFGMDEMASPMLVEGPDGALYGTMPYGGEFGAGAIYRMSHDGSDYTILHSFSWDNGEGSETQGITFSQFDGFFYGIAMTGGEFGQGSLFRIKPDGSQFEVLHQFTGGDDNGNPVAALTQVGDRAFCGITATWEPRGTVFRLEQDPLTAAWSVTTIHRLEADIGYPGPPLLLASDGFLYGVTYEGDVSWGGAVFRLKPDGTDFALVHDFSNDGELQTSWPAPGLTEGSDGALYGVTGGDWARGSIFRLAWNPATLNWDFHTLFVFSDDQENPNWIFGTNPFTALITGPDGAFYGTNTRGGYAGGDEYGEGTIFKLNPLGGSIDLIHVFTGGEDGAFLLGAFPLALVPGSDSAIYGTTGWGGGEGNGTIFRLPISAADTAPPTVTSVTATPATLWPANNKLVSVQLAAAAVDDTDPAPVSVISSVTCNEPLKPGDVVVTGELTVQLRAARSGKGKTGRIYTINVNCTDQSGNAATASVAVTVPHDQGKKK